MKLISKNKILKCQKGLPIYLDKRSNGNFLVSDENTVRRALGLTENLANNYSWSLDHRISRLRESVTRLLEKLNCSTGLSNCTLTATLWVDPLTPLNRATSIITDPDKYDYAQIDESQAVPGTLIIASKDPNTYGDGENNAYHSMILTGFAEEDKVMSLNDKKYFVKKGEPLVTYSRGKSDWKQNYVQNAPLKAYIDLSHGKVYTRFYKPKTTSIQVVLPEVEIIGKLNPKPASESIYKTLYKYLTNNF